MLLQVKRYMHERFIMRVRMILATGHALGSLPVDLAAGSLLNL